MTIFFQLRNVTILYIRSSTHIRNEVSSTIQSSDGLHLQQAIWLQLSQIGVLQHSKNPAYAPTMVIGDQFDRRPFRKAVCKVLT